MQIRYLLILMMVLITLLTLSQVNGKKSKKDSTKKKAKETLKAEDKPKEEIEKPEEPEFLDDSNSTIQDLDHITQLHYLMKQEKFSLLYMYHEDNEASQEGLIEFKKTEKKLRGYANFLLIGCHKESFQNPQTPMCEQEADSGIFPLLSGFIPPSIRFNPYTKKVEDNQEMPFGNRPKTEKAMSKFVTSSIPNYVIPLNKNKEFDSKLSGAKKINKVVLFTEKSTSPVLYKALASNFKDFLDFYFIDANKLKKTVKAQGISEFPTIQVHVQFDRDGEKLESADVVTYKGNNDIQELTDFLTPYALADKFDPNAADKPQSQRRSKYTFVNHKNYTKAFVEDYRAQVVFFDTDYANVQEKFEAVAKSIHGPANVVFFNCKTEEAQKLVDDKFGVKKFPRVMVYSTGAEKNIDSALEISIATDAEDIVDIVSETEVKSNLKEVSDSMVSSIILNNAVQLNKITLVYLYEGEDNDVPLSFKAVSTNPQFANNFEFIALKNPGSLTVQQFQVPKLPVIIGGIPPPEDVDPASPEAANSIRTMIFQGNIEDYYELLEYNLGVLQTFFPHSEEAQHSNDRDPKAITEFEEVTADNFDEICESKKGFCAIAFLEATTHTKEDILNHEEKLALLEERNRESSSQFKYMWVNASCHSEILPEFDLSPMFLPTVIIYSPSQQKYARIVNIMNKENLMDFENSFQGGKGRTIVNDAPEDIAGKVKKFTTECENIQLEGEFVEEDMMDKEMEEEIMREILEEEERKRQQLDTDTDSTSKKKKKKSKKAKKTKK